MADRPIPRPGAPHPRRLLLAFALATASLIVTTVVALAATGSVKMTEANDRYAFTPGSLSVRVGDTVTWTNASDAMHTVTSDSGTVLAAAPIAPGGTFSHTFGTTGTFAYHCSIHPYMTGTIAVLAAGATTPATDTSPVSPMGGGLPASGVAGLAIVAGLVGFGLVGLRLRERR